MSTRRDYVGSAALLPDEYVCITIVSRGRHVRSRLPRQESHGLVPLEPFASYLRACFRRFRRRPKGCPGYRPK